MRKALIFVAVGLLLFVLFVGFLSVRALRFKSTQIAVLPAADKPQINNDTAAARLSKAIQFPTISNQDPGKSDVASFQGLHQFLTETYPRVHAELGREVISDYSLLYTWKGSDAALKPMLLMAHMDVVPIEPGTEKNWTHPPFSGEIADGFIWGRGSLDDKVSVLGILESVEMLLGEGFKPKRTVYLSFGHNEEVGGIGGASQIAELLKQRGIQLEYVLDEGMAITRGIIPGVKPQVALIGIAEKGYLTVEMIANGPGGHSSMPPPQTAVGILAKAVYELEKQPMPGVLQGPVKQMFESVGPEMPFANRLALANLWLFGGVVGRQLESSPATNASYRTTMAATIIEGGIKENVVPSKARAIVNFRLRPGDKSSDVIDHMKKVVDDERVEINPLEETRREASPVSSTKAPAYKMMEKTIRELYPGIVVAPSLVTGATDSRYFTIVCDNVYRFCPMWMASEDLARIHGMNERISVENYGEIIRFYRQLIKNSISQKNE